MDSTSIFASSLKRKNSFQSFEEFKLWFAGCNRPDEFKVEQVPITQMESWSFDEHKTRLSHISGRFFSIEGIHVETNFGCVPKWEQPIISQPEIGILGIITKVFDGVRYFLMQAKMEPGNIGVLQLSPTVQATKSNFSRVHKGKLPSYLEFFNGEKCVKMLVDQLQTEQGGRFYQKRNRNMLVEVEEDIELLDGFCWMTLGELKYLLREDNILNMDTRSVISTIPLVEDEVLNNLTLEEVVDIRELSANGKEFFKSFITSSSLNSVDDIISWYNQQKTYYEIFVNKVPLCKLKEWSINDNEIHSSDSRFSVIGVKVTAGTREVRHWMQPLLKDEHIGLLAFVVQKIDGILHFLIQAKVEPGNKDIIELSPTVSCSNYHHMKLQRNRPYLFDEILNNRNKILYDACQSEEGGRFYKIQNRNMIVEIAETEKLDLPMNYIWMSLRQMKEFMRYGMFNIEARSIISGISFID